MQQDIKTNKAIIFGVYDPDGITLAEALDEWNHNETSANNFIDEKMKLFYKNVRDFKQTNPVVYAIYSKEGSFREYSIRKLSSSTFESDKIELQDYHPLQKWISQFQAAIAENGLVGASESMQGTTPLNLTTVRNTAVELFQTTYRLYKANKTKDFIEARQNLLNFFSDPACLFAALLGAILNDTKEKLPNNIASDSQSFPSIDLPLLPPITQTPIIETQATLLLAGESESLPEESTSSNALSIINGNSDSSVTIQDTIQYIKNLPARFLAAKELIIQKSPDREFLTNVRSHIGKDILHESETHFLMFCLSDHKLLERFSELSAILIDPKDYIAHSFQNGQDRTEKIKETSDKICSLLLQELAVVGNLIRNVEGLKTITAAFPKTCGDIPRMLIPNCSLSDLYETDARRDKFNKVMIALNGPESILSDRIGIAILPSISTLSDQDESDEFHWDDDATQNPTETLGDDTRRSDLLKFLTTVGQEQLNIMSFFSLKLDVPVNKLVNKYFNRGDEGFYEFAIDLQNRKKNSPEDLKNAALCLPDKLIFNDCKIKLTEDCGGELNMPALTLKGAFQVAALVIRNDSAEALKALLPNQQSLIKDQAGVVIGPDIAIKDKNLKDKFPTLFELDSMTSDMNIDSDILQQVDNQGCYCFLQHTKGKPVQLRTFNTLHLETGDITRHTTVNEVRTGSYLRTSTVKCKKTIADLKKDCSKDNEKGYINSLKPDNYNLIETDGCLIIQKQE